MKFTFNVVWRKMFLNVVSLKKEDNYGKDLQGLLEGNLVRGDVKIWVI